MSLESISQLGEEIRFLQKDGAFQVCVEVMKRWYGHGKLMELVTHVLMHVVIGNDVDEVRFGTNIYVLGDSLVIQGDENSQRKVQSSLSYWILP